MQLAMQRDALGYDMDVPWISRDKVHIEISYKVTNLSDERAPSRSWSTAPANTRSTTPS